MQFIHQQQDDQPLARLCATLGIARSAYYRWAAQPASRTAAAANTAVVADCEQQQITRLILQQFNRHQARYGTRRMVAELTALGHDVGRDRVRAIYHEYDLHAIQPKSFVPRTTQSHPNRRRSPNLLLDMPPPTLPDQVWVSDITYLPMQQAGSFCYLATLQDQCSRTIVGYEVADHMREELTLTALRRALTWRKPAAGLIVHSDGGGQYSSIEYRKQLQDRGHRSSMTRRDNHYDNAQAESLFSRFKAELLIGPSRRFVSLDEATTVCFEYIEGYYNTVRRHSSLGYLSPLDFEKQLKW